MRIRGFNFVGEFDTKATAENDPVHTIYCMDNNALAAIIQDRRKKMGNKFYIVYGYNPRFGTYMAKWGAWDSYAECRHALEYKFEEQHPDILVNNHRADYISRIYGSMWEEGYLARQGDTQILRHTYHFFNNHDSSSYWRPGDSHWTDKVTHEPEVEHAVAEFDMAMAVFKEGLNAAPVMDRRDRLYKAIEPTPWRV